MPNEPRTTPAAVYETEEPGILKAHAARWFVLGEVADERLHCALEPSCAGTRLVARTRHLRVESGRGASGDEHDLREMLRWTRAHRLVIAPEALPDGEIADLVLAAEAMGLRVTLLPRLSGA